MARIVRADMIVRILLALLISFSAAQAQPTVGPIDHREIGVAVPAMNDSRISGAAPLASPAFTGTPTAPTISLTAPSSVVPAITMNITGIANASRNFYTSVNGEMVLQNNQSGLNTLMIENMNMTGFSAVGLRGPDYSYPSTAAYTNGSYEHSAMYYGPTLSTNGRSGQVGWEISRYPTGSGSGFATTPPSTGVIIQTGGAFTGTPYSLNISTTLGATAVTLNGGGNFPSDVNGMVISEVGDVAGVVPPGTTVVSGQGTATLTLSAAALVTNGFERMLVGTTSFGVYAAMVFTERTNINFYPYSTGSYQTPYNPYLMLDRIHGRVGMGAFTNTQTPIDSLDVVGHAYFGSDNSTKRTTASGGGSVNIIDSGSIGYSWYNTGSVNNVLRQVWTSTGVAFNEATYGTNPLNLATDGTAAVTVGTLRISSLGGPSKASGSVAPITTTFNGVTGAATGVPVAGSEYTNTAGSGGAQKFVFRAGTWIAEEMNWPSEMIPGAVGIGSGGTLNLSTNGYIVVTTAGGSIAAANIVLPTSVGLTEGSVARAVFIGTVTSPTWSSVDSKTIAGAPTTLNTSTGGIVIAFKWSAALNEWLVWK